MHCGFRTHYYCDVVGAGGSRVGAPADNRYRATGTGQQGTTTVVKKLARHVVQLSLAWLLIAIGIVFLLSPIPVGIFFIAAGLSVLIYTSDKVTAKICAFRQRHQALNRQLHWVEEKLGDRVKFVSVAMGRTRPAPE